MYVFNIYLLGLIILKTKHGNLYLTQVKNSTKTETTTSSLSSLMNECLTQSNMVQELLNKKALQSRLFAAVSKFASLKLMSKFLNVVYYISNYYFSDIMPDWFKIFKTPIMV